MTDTPHSDRRTDWHQDRRHNQFQDRGGLAGYQYRLEPTVEEYVARLVAVFDEVRRVLAPTGTAWLNLGDSYSSAITGSPKRGRRQPGGAPVPQPGPQVLPPKNLISVPWRAVFA